MSAEMRDPAHPVHQEHAGREKEKEKQQRGTGAAELEPDEEKKAEEEESLNASITHEVIRREGIKELERPASALAWSGLAAGLSMCFSFATEGVLHAHLPDAPWRILVAKLGYAMGFLIVILGSQQLYTENTLTPIVPLMARKTREMFRKVGMLWSVVFLTNLVGALLFAWAIAYTDAFSLEVRHAFDTIALKSAEGDVPGRIVRGVFAGWLIALLVWMLPAAENSRVLVIVVMTWLVGAGELAHVIVGSVEMFYLAAKGLMSYGTALVDHILPTLVGNTLGGVTMVAAINHAQVTSGK